MQPLEGKVFAITGASRGIGAATALALAGEGCRLGLGGRDEAALEEVVRGVSEAGGEAVAVQCDVRRYGDCERLVSETTGRFGGLDGLVANAGVGAYGGLLDLSPVQIDEMLDTNARGTIYSVRAALPALLDGGGDLVIVASVAGLKGLPNESVYCASKHAQVGFAEALDHELRPRGIRVTAMCPGGVATEFAFGAGRTPDMPELREMMSADQVAEAIVFALRQDPQLRTLRLVMRPMSEPA
ncbi:MAG: SDR family NAD(P)-dependent oxidoreductase [Rubrobacter sp.]|nr:SDR family NAD(P)-dependent oxidoreductase [Rubrobacter sp.]